MDVSVVGEYFFLDQLFERFCHIDTPSHPAEHGEIFDRFFNIGCVILETKRAKLLEEGRVFGHGEATFY